MFSLDFTKFGDSFSEALQKAKDDLEKGVDDALGIAGSEGNAAAPLQESKNSPAAVASASAKAPHDAPDMGPGKHATSTASSSAASSTAIGEDGVAPATASPAKKKTIKKVVKKAVQPIAEGEAAVAKTDPEAAASRSEGGQASASLSTSTHPDAAAGSTAAAAARSHEDAACSDTHLLQSNVISVGPAARETAGQDPGSHATSSSPNRIPAASEEAAAPPDEQQQHRPSSDSDPPASLPSESTNGISSIHGFSSWGNGPAASAASAANGSMSRSAMADFAATRGAEAAEAEAVPSPPGAANASLSRGALVGASSPPLLVPVLPALLPGVEIPELASMEQAALLVLVEQLRESVSSREQQLIRQAEQVSIMHQTMAALTERNEELVLKSTKISEQDFEEIRTEFEQRLGAAERKVYALTKERDALKKGTEKLSDYGNLIREKDAIIKQVMEEGEKLASKQSDMEVAMRKLRQQMSASESDRDKLVAKLAAEQAESEGLRKARAKLERDLASAQEQAKSDLESQRNHLDQMLVKAKADQLDAESRARDAASQGLARKLKESEGRCEALTESVVEMREALERQRQAADLREEMLKQDIADLERRCQSSELRHQELTSKLPDATRPLLRQIEAMQAAAEAQSDAWEAAERALSSRSSDAEGRAAAAVERERLTIERSQVLTSRVAALEAALSATRDEAKRLSNELAECQRRFDSLEEACRMSQQKMEVMLERNRLLVLQSDQAAQSSLEALAVERDARHAAEADAIRVQRQCEERLAEAEAELRTLGSSAVYSSRRGSENGLGGGGWGAEPPAMAAPGYHWVLVRDGELHHQQQQPHRGSVHDGAGSESAAAGNSAERGGLQRGSDSAADSMTGMVVSELSQSNSALASEVEGLRAALRIAHGEMSSMEGRIRELQASRDRLAEELVTMAQKSEKAADIIYEMQSLRQEIADTRTRYIAAVELLGERDESLEELRADLKDVKHLYKDQIEFMCCQLTNLQTATSLSAPLSQQPSDHSPAPG